MSTIDITMVSPEVFFVNENTLMLAGHLSDEEALAALKVQEGPLAAMLRGEKTFDLGPYQGLKLLRPQMQPRHCLYKGMPHTMFRLSSVEALLHKAWLAQAGKYDWARFLSQYEEATRKAIARIWHRAIRSHGHQGLYAQANTDPRVGRNQAGLHAKDLYQLLKRYYPQLLQEHGIKSWKGMGRLPEVPILLQVRYPVADTVLLSQVVLIGDRPGGKIYWNWEDLQILAGGDEDGDGAAVALPSSIDEEDLVGLVQAEAFPTPQVAPDGSGPLLDQLIAKYEAERGSVEDFDDYVLELVCGMLVKQFTGLLTYVFWLFERQAAVRAARNAQGKDLAVAQFQAACRQYRGVSKLYAPLLEKVMDAGKPGQTVGRAQLERLITAIQKYMAGGKLAPTVRELVEAFEPFMNAQDQSLLGGLLRGIGTDRSAIRETAVGRLIAAGRNNGPQARALQPILEAMVKQDLPGEEFLDTLYDDAFAFEFFPMENKKQEDKEKEPRIKTPELFTLDLSQRVKPAILNVVAGIQYRGKPVFQNIRHQVAEDGTLKVQAVMMVHWTPTDRHDNVYCFPVSFHLPKVERVGSWGKADFRHFQVSFPRRQAVLFRPVFRIQEDHQVVEVGLLQFLAEHMLESVKKLAQRKLAWRTEEKRPQIQALLSQWLGFNLAETVCEELPAYDPAFAYVHQHKVVLQIPQFEEPDTLRDWGYRRELLTWMKEQKDEHGPLYGVGYTAKDAEKVGTEAAILDRSGFPRYAVEWDPMIGFAQGNPKRWAEYQYTDPQPLAFPKPFPVRAQGMERPAVLTALGAETTLLCAMVSVVGVNVFLDEEGQVQNHDTTAFTWHGAEALSLAFEKKYFKTLEEAEAWVSEALVEDEELTVDQIEIEETWKEIEPQVEVRQIVGRIWKPTLDTGKVKGLAPFKGVQSVIPTSYFVYRDGERVEIDCLLPHHTAVKKQALNALLMGLAAKAGIEELDPTMPLPALVEMIQSTLRAKGLSDQGLETVYWEDEDGNSHKLCSTVVVPLPWYRPSQTESSVFSIKDDIAIELHAMLIAGRPVDPACESWMDARTEAASLYEIWKDLGRRLA